MRPTRKSFLERLSLGYNFGQEREALSLVYISYFLIILFSVVVVLLHRFEDDLFPITYRYHALIGINVINLWLLWKRRINLAIILTLTSLPFILLILPPLGGVHSDEFYFWFPYIPIGLSILSHFILHPVRQRIQLFIVLGFYLFLGLFISNFMMLLSDGSEMIIPIVVENSFYYRLIPLFLFLFVNVALRLLFVKNHKYQIIMDLQHDELVQSEKMAAMGILVSGLAHEINNPLNFISGSLNALAALKTKFISIQNEPSKEEEELIKQMDQVSGLAFEGVERATNVITKLRFFAQPELNRDLKEIRLAELIQSTLRSIESRLPEYLFISTDMPKNLNVLCHEQELRLVCMHILRNAIDAIESREKRGREHINISASQESMEGKPYTRISFFNSGPPIPGKSLKHIFDPFYSSREVGQGIGLGMSLSYMIIREHGGKLKVNNQEDGVSFDIYLPQGPGKSLRRKGIPFKRFLDGLQ